MRALWRRAPIPWLLLLLPPFLPAAWGGVTQQEAARLDGELTPLGAVRAANADGSIPAWKGGLAEPPAGFAAGMRQTDPFPEDGILYTITAADLDRRGHLLSDGQQALLRTHPETWRIHVYPTRRSAAFPPFVERAVRENATRAQLGLEGRGAVTGARIGPPFPIPRRGVEVVWNHNLRWQGIRVERKEGLAAVTRLGRYRRVLLDQLLGLPYGAEQADAFGRAHPNVLFALKAKIIDPSRLAKNASLVIEPVDFSNASRRAWLYERALRRVVRVPFLGHGFPAPYSENLRTTDDVWLFNGSPDRFEWELLGRREILIPYNAYRLHSGDVGPEDILRRHHIAPELARYELHRVWVVEGRLRPEEKHVYSRRVFYVDEDSWQIALAESYDQDGQLWRVNEAHAVQLYDVPALTSTLEVFHDLKERRYLVSGLDNDRHAWRFSGGNDAREFNPNALAYDVR